MFTLTATQSGGAVIGDWGVTGAITGSYGLNVPSTDGGTFQATIPLGADPSFMLRIARPTFCPDYVVDLDASYDSKSGVLTLVGPMDILSSQCQVMETYQMSVGLKR